MTRDEIASKMVGKDNGHLSDYLDNLEKCVFVRSRRLHIYRNGNKVLVPAGRPQPEIIGEDSLNSLLSK